MPFVMLHNPQPALGSALHFEAQVQAALDQRHIL